MGIEKIYKELNCENDMDTEELQYFFEPKTFSRFLRRNTPVIHVKFNSKDVTKDLNTILNSPFSLVFYVSGIEKSCKELNCKKKPLLKPLRNNNNINYIK